jgi:CheY-like chemotaxis protein
MISTVLAPLTIPPGRPLDVIVADDESADNFLMVLAAVDAGAQMNFTFAEDGEEFLQVLAARVAAGNIPDLVVLDIRMPRCSGLEVMEAIAESEFLRRIPVVMFTTSRRATDRKRGVSLGVTRFEIKPNSYAGLVSFMGELASAFGTGT